MKAPVWVVSNISMMSNDLVIKMFESEENRSR
jgi:hypothetical protein